ncbi:unnamed protein product [Choristocarpus tenellus]
MSSLLTSYKDWANGVGDIILEWARDGQPVGPTKDWPLADFSSALAIMVAYLMFVVVGRVVMEKQQAVGTYPIQFVYNMVQVVLCSYMCVEATVLAYRQGYSIVPCNPFNYSNPPVANVLWLFYISKILDFLDTVFIVTNKAWRRLSFLHVYHHCTIFMFYWLNLNAGYDGDVYFTVTLNGFIHTVMYTYYFVSMHTRDIWWKKYLTMMQMIQFVGMATQAFWLLGTGCKSYPRRIVAVYAGYILSLLFLFAQFYIQSYTKPKNKTKTKTT